MTSLLHRDFKQKLFKVREYKGRRAKKIKYNKYRYETFEIYESVIRGNMAKVKMIIDAWKKVFDELTTDEDVRRSKICGKCPHAKNKRILQLIKDDLIETKGMLCDLCGCPLSAKIRSEDICEKWKQHTK